MESEDRYFLLYTLNHNYFETITLLDKKMKRVYCGSPIGSDSISLKEYGWAINRDIKIPINKNTFLKIKNESYIELRKKDYVEFFIKYSLDEWII
jgi:hypothetical protein